MNSAHHHPRASTSACGRAARQQRGRQAATRSSVPAIAVLAGALVITVHPVAALAACQIGIVAELPVDSAAAGQIVTSGEVNGRPVKILLDTGSETSIVWRSSVERLGLKPVDGGVKLIGVGGASQVQLARIDELKIDKFVSKNLTFPIAGDRPGSIDMLLGEGVLSRFTVEFDLGHKTVRLLTYKDCHTTQLAYWSKSYQLMDLVANPRSVGKILTNVKLNDQTVRAELDSGAAFTVVSSAFARNAGATNIEQRGSAHGIGAALMSVSNGTFQTIAVGDEVVRNATVGLADLNHNSRQVELGSRIAVERDILPDMLLGADFLSSHRVIVPPDAKQIVFSYEGGPVFQHRPTPPPDP